LYTKSKWPATVAAELHLSKPNWTIIQKVNRGLYSRNSSVPLYYIMFKVHVTGLKGNQGLEGPQGVKGEKGNIGNTGATGLKGATGAHGVPGINFHYGIL